MNDYEIKKLYEKMEMEIISSMKRNYKRHLKEENKTGFKYTQWQAEKLKELKRYQRENKDIIDDYTNGLSDEISKHLQEELRQGSINAIKQYNKVLKQNLKPDKIMNKSFFKTNDRKVNALIKSVNNDLKTANTAILRMSNDQYRQVIHKSAFFVGNGVFTERQATRMATKELTELQLTKLAIDEANKDFLSRGLACIEYSDGRRVNVASYSQMAVRTANLRAQLMGEGDFRKSIGRHLVQATSHGGACPICQKWEKHIFIDDVYSGGSKKDGNYTLLSVAMKQGFLHPNCRHGLTTYYPELDGIENESEEEYQDDMDYINQRINYIERNIKRYDRLAKGSIAPLDIQMFANKKKQWINEKRILQNLYYDDVTSKMLKNATPNSHKVLDREFYMAEDGTKYKLKGTDVMLNYTDDEKKTAELLENILGGEIYMNPKVNKPDGIKAADYFFRGNNWDKKRIKDATSKLRAIDNVIKEKRSQAKRFVLDVTGCKLTNDEIIKQVENIFIPGKYQREWVEEIIIIRDDKLIKYYQKK